MCTLQKQVRFQQVLNVSKEITKAYESTSRTRNQAQVTERPVITSSATLHSSTFVWS